MVFWRRRAFQLDLGALCAVHGCRGVSPRTRKTSIVLTHGITMYTVLSAFLPRCFSVSVCNAWPLTHVSLLWIPMWSKMWCKAREGIGASRSLTVTQITSPRFSSFHCGFLVEAISKPSKSGSRSIFYDSKYCTKHTGGPNGIPVFSQKKQICGEKNIDRGCVKCFG